MSLVHDALVYGSDDEFVDALAPFVRDGLDDGATVCVVTPPSGWGLLRDALDDPLDDVRFVDSATWYETPARTIAGYNDIIREAVDGDQQLRVVGEVEFGDDERAHAEWTRYESVLNAVFADAPAWVVCPYDRRRLPDHVIEGCQLTHPHVAEHGSRRGSEVFRDPQQYVGPLPLPVEGVPLGSISLGSSLGPVRDFVREITLAQGVSDERASDITMAVHELASNALAHGAPPASVTAWLGDAGVVFEVADHGHGIDSALAGFAPPPRGAVGGMGLWLARQLSDRMEVEVGTNGTTVRVSVAGA